MRGGNATADYSPPPADRPAERLHPPCPARAEGAAPLSFKSLQLHHGFFPLSPLLSCEVYRPPGNKKKKIDHLPLSITHCVLVAPATEQPRQTLVYPTSAAVSNGSTDINMTAHRRVPGYKGFACTCTIPSFSLCSLGYTLYC